jgi:hypothetical protein
MERTLAMDAGKFEQQVAWLDPAQKPNPFQFLESVDFKDAGLNLANEDQENPSPEAQGGDVQMAASGAAPDVEPEADSAGQVANVRRRAVPRAQPVQQIAPQPQRQPNFFQRLFGPRRPAPQPAQPAPPPRRPGQPNQQQPRRGSNP